MRVIIYFPAAHAEHRFEAGGGHWSQDEAPILAENVPSGQSRHNSLEADPSIVEYLPTLQDEQSRSASALSNSTYVPAGHNVHVVFNHAPRVDEYLPPLHEMHDDDDVAPTATLMYFPAPHIVQAASLNLLLYLP